MSLFFPDGEPPPKPKPKPVERKQPKASNSMLVMINDKGQPTEKPKECWRWTRMERGYGWHDPVEVPLPKY